MCQHNFIILDAATFMEEIDDDIFKLTLVEILFCTQCEENDTRRETVIQNKENKSTLPEWTFRKHKKIFNHV